MSFASFYLTDSCAIDGVLSVQIDLGLDVLIAQPFCQERLDYTLLAFCKCAVRSSYHHCISPHRCTAIPPLLSQIIDTAIANADDWIEALELTG